jgi:Cu(I)/Ag(I) efflux system membrane fusion protein
MPLVIPASAPLLTGKRAVVYVAASDTANEFEGREVVLGARAGDFYPVVSGLAEGERVVVNGAFKIDSAVQILARPSMMNPEGGAVTLGHSHEATHAEPAAAVGKTAEEHAGHTGAAAAGTASGTHTGQSAGEASPGGVPAAFTSQLGGVYDAYLAVHTALSGDRLANARTGASALVKSLEKADMTLLGGETHMAWMKELEILRENGEAIVKAGSLENARAAFIPLSSSLIRVAGTFGVPGTKPLYRIHCPMADNNKGADWLQDKKTVENPFFGSKMFTCGELKETIPAGGGTR